MLKEDILEVKNKVNKFEKQVNENSFALEMLSELKSNSKRWFLIAVIELILLLGTNVGWLVYNSQFETVTTTEQVIEDVDSSTNSNYTQTIQ